MRTLCKLRVELLIFVFQTSNCAVWQRYLSQHNRGMWILPSRAFANALCLFNASWKERLVSVSVCAQRFRHKARILETIRVFLSVTASHVYLSTWFPFLLIGSCWDKLIHITLFKSYVYSSIQTFAQWLQKMLNQQSVLIRKTLCCWYRQWPCVDMWV